MCRIAFLLLLLPLTACSAQEPEPADSAANNSAVALGAPDPALIEACVEQTNMGEAVCTCVARKAKGELSDKEHTFLLATVQGDDEETERLRGELSVQEAMRAGTFLVNAPRECAGG